MNRRSTVVTSRCRICAKTSFGSHAGSPGRQLCSLRLRAPEMRRQRLVSLRSDELGSLDATNRK